MQQTKRANGPNQIEHDGRISATANQSTMTAADIRDILQLPQAGPSAPKAKSKSKKGSGKRADAMTRELYSLMGDNAPSITLALPKMKERPKIRTKAVPW
jgi:DNA methyltransferase 1-associated protein 1